jgi:hypothetical protein
MAMSMGKLPARINSVYMRLGTYVDTAAVAPLIPAVFGPGAVEFDALGSDQLRCGVWAGFAYETMLWAREAGREVMFSADSVLSDYAEATGYTPEDPASDRGTDLQAAASYRRRIGCLDAAGVRHRVGGYAALAPGDPDQLAVAAYIFGSVGVGLRMPGYALADFAAERAWDVRFGIAEIVGGHYVPVVGRTRTGNFQVIAWGRLHEMTPGFFRRYCDEAIAYLPEEIVTTPRGPDGFDRAALIFDLYRFTRR